jgi:hypothetical protein
MTGRERILAAFRCDYVDRVPFAPNIYQWFYSRRAAGTLPHELQGMEHPFEALRALGADILARWDTEAATEATYTSGEMVEEYGGTSANANWTVTAFNRYPPRSNRCTRRFETPWGPLREEWSLSEAAAADFQREYMWKDWNDFPKIKFLLEARHYQFDAARFRRWYDRVGSDGIVMVHLTQSPLKTFHWLAGPETTAYLIADHPKEMRELAELHEEKAIDLLKQTLNLPEAEVFMSLDNLDSAFYSPKLYDQFCAPFFSRSASIIHEKGKHLVVHACGHTRGLLPRVAASGIDCLEGIAPPPIGDTDFGEIRKLVGRSQFTINGGIEVRQVEERSQAKSKIFSYTRQLFSSLGDLHGFIFASSCNTSPIAPWENLVLFREAATEYGVL